MSNGMARTQEADRRYWDRLAKSYDRTGLVWGRPFPRMLELVEREVRGRRRVLEVAAGTGLVTSRIARAAEHVTATDYSAAMLDVLRERVRREGLSNVECLERDVYALGFPPRAFDAVVCANVLHLLPDLPKALAAMRAVLEPDGVLVAPTFLHGESLTARVLSHLAGVTGFPVQRRFSAKSLGDALAAAGLEVRLAETIPGAIPIGFVSGTFPNEARAR
jgi:ubiquinone/menaquinone biosynthesis C-methylase UbiE